MKKDINQNMQPGERCKNLCGVSLTVEDMDLPDSASQTHLFEHCTRLECGNLAV